MAANVCLRDYGGGGSERGIQRILIVDLDVHQGNGNAVLFQQEPRVFTFSMHCSGNYFSAKQASDLDVEVPPGSGDEAYLALLAEHLPAVFAQHSPDLVFYQGGIDILASDRLGRLELSREGARERNRMVYEAVSAAGARLVVTVRALVWVVGVVIRFKSHEMHMYVCIHRPAVAILLIRTQARKRTRISSTRTRTCTFKPPSSLVGTATDSWLHFVCVDGRAVGPLKKSTFWCSNSSISRK